MPTKVTVTKAEEAALEWAFDGCTNNHAKALESLLAKVRRAKEPKAKSGLSIAEAEKALSTCLKYAPYKGGNPAPLLKMLAYQGVTPAQLRTVGDWVDDQKWLSNVDLAMIARNWVGWLARASAENSGREGTGYFTSSKPAGFVDD